MGFFRNLFRKRPDDRAEAKAAAPEVAKNPTQPEHPGTNAADMLNALSERMDGTPTGAQAASIWDIADDPAPQAGFGAPTASPAADPAAAPIATPPSDPTSTPVPTAAKRRNKTRLIGFDTSDSEAVNLFDDDSAPQPAAPVSGTRRNKTRLIGFDTSEGDVVGLFDDTEAPQAATDAGADLPVGWLVVTEGPGRGTVSTLVTGATDLGHGPEAGIHLQDPGLGDSPVATLTHDHATGGFTLTATSAQAEVQLDGTAIPAAAPLASGARIQVGGTTLRFVALCDASFAWAEHAHGPGGQEVGYVAQA